MYKLKQGMLVTNIVECKTPPAPLYEDEEEENKKEHNTYNKELYNSDAESEKDEVNPLPNITNIASKAYYDNKLSQHSGKKSKYAIDSHNAISIKNANEVSKLLSENKVLQAAPISKEGNPFCIDKAKMISKNRKSIRTGGFSKK